MEKLPQPASQQADYWPCELGEERECLGALIIDPAQLTHLHLLSEDLFGLSAHQQIFRAISALALRGLTLDYLEVSAELRRRGQLEAIGGCTYLSQLISMPIVLARSMSRRAAVLREVAVRRKLISVGAQLVESAVSADPDELIAQTRETLEKLGGFHA